MTCERATAEEWEIMRAKREFRLKAAEVDTEERKYLAGVARERMMGWRRARMV